MSIIITSLPTASTIDGAADTFPIVTSNINTTQQISRNTFLNLSSQPVGISDSQTLTNKVLTSPTINGATLSGTLSGTYTIGGTPTFPSSVVTLTGSQTLTNKILTSPTINAPTITNATISADAVTGFSVSNTGTIYGISVTTGTIGSAALAANSVTSTAIAAGAVQPQALQSGTGSTWVWASWTPTITAVSGTFTSVSATGKYIQIGKTVYFRLDVTITTNGTAAGAVLATLPITASTSNSYIGGGRGDVVSGKQQHLRLNSSTQVSIYNYDGTYGGSNTEVLRCNGFYEAA